MRSWKASLPIFSLFGTGSILAGVICALQPTGALAQTSDVYDLWVANLRVEIAPDGHKHVSWDVGLALPRGMAPIPLRATLWRLDASGNRQEIVWDRYYGDAAPAGNTDFNCPNVDYCSQFATACQNPPAGFCSTVHICPDGHPETVNGVCRTHDFGKGQGLCDALACLCTTEGDPCPPAGGGPGVDLPPGNYWLDLQECDKDDPLDPDSGQCGNDPCHRCTDGNRANDGAPI